MKILIFLLLLFVWPFTALAQDIKPTPTPGRPKSPNLPTGGRPVIPSTLDGRKTMSLGGTVTFRGEVMPNVEVTAINSRTGKRRDATTDAMGRFVINGLVPGSYEVRAKRAGFEMSRQDVQLHLGQTAALNVSLNRGLNTVDPGEIPIGKPAAGGVNTGAVRAPTVSTSSADVPVVPPSPNQSASTAEFVAKDFDNDIELVNWLITKKTEKKLLIRILTIRDKTSLFMFQTVKGAAAYQYTVSLVNEILDEKKLLTRINLNKGKTFIGLHLLTQQSYLIVFYGK